MDRIPTTNGGALGGGWETVAGPMAGMPAGRFSGREVWVAPETPHPFPGQGQGTGSSVASIERPETTRFGTATGVAFSSGLPGATAMPQTRTVEFDPARQPVPAFRPPAGPRTGQGPSGFALESSTEPPGTTSSAIAASDVHKRQASLPEPSPAVCYRSRWDAFVRWCVNHNAQYWPASPETVADYLKDCAAKYSAMTLRVIRSTIANTHREAGLADPCATGVVKSTCVALVKAQGGVCGHGTNLTGCSLDATQLDSIRAAALDPKRKGCSGVESRETVWQRGGVTLALCSLVLEAGLRCDEAAALEWQDLWQGENDAPAITIRNGSAEADRVVGISLRACKDLVNIAPEHAGPGTKIFALTVRQVAGRIRGAARGAGLESQIEGKGKCPRTRRTARGSGRETAVGPKAGTPAGTPAGRFGQRRVSVALETPRPLLAQEHGRGSDFAGVDWFRVNPFATAARAIAAGGVRERQESPPEPSPTACYRSIWNAFVRWCEERNAEHWPASPETVANYLKHRAKRCSMGTVYNTKNAISATHRGAGWGKLFAGGIVAATLAELASIKGEVRSRSRIVSGSPLHAVEIDRIRAAALERRPIGQGFESHENATRRGRVDLALCSLVLEAGLEVEQAAALEWRDLAVDANERPTITISAGRPGPARSSKSRNEHMAISA